MKDYKGALYYLMTEVWQYSPDKGEDALTKKAHDDLMELVDSTAPGKFAEIYEKALDGLRQLEHELDEPPFNEDTRIMALNLFMATVGPTLESAARFRKAVEDKEDELRKGDPKTMEIINAINTGSRFVTKEEQDYADEYIRVNADKEEYAIGILRKLLEGDE